MFFDAVKIFFNTRRQTIRSIKKAALPSLFRGVPEISSRGLKPDELKKMARMCPSSAIHAYPFSIDLGRCMFCGECQRQYPKNVKFTSNPNMWAFRREDLLVYDGKPWKAKSPETPFKKFRKSFRLRQLSAGGDMGTELELGACSNVNFDMGRFGIEFTASPRHAEALAVTGPLTVNMAYAAEKTWEAIPDPKLLIAAGTDAISGGMFADSEDIDRTFFKNHTPDLYVPGCPVHPLTFIAAVASLTGRKLP